MSHTALDTFLEPLNALFAEEGIQEISINRPGEAWVEKFGDMRYEPLPQFTHEHLQALAHLIAQSTSQTISEEKPLLSATLPGGYRVQVVFPPACADNGIAMSIRKQAALMMTLDTYEQLGAFATTKTGLGTHDPADDILSELYAKGDVKGFIAQAVKFKKNIIISGGTSTGKTTFMNAALTQIPASERIITVEDAREVQIDHIPNRVHLMVSKGGQGRAKVTTQELIEACLRLRPDRIIVGELRGAEAFSYLRAVNTGHPGSVATIHADSPTLAIEQLILMIMQADLGITRDQIKAYVESVIQVIIQLKRGEKGRRYVSEVYFKPGA
ncbi:MAG: P-type DNA transfer ATPase VirB11 [Alphaproteobacteria bacterium]|nr:P-type DNA transfer ATPase VirB11 [Alphaproteobacteria bacterium]